MVCHPTSPRGSDTQYPPVRVTNPFGWQTRTHRCSCPPGSTFGSHISMAVRLIWISFSFCCFFDCFLTVIASFFHRLIVCRTRTNTQPSTKQKINNRVWALKVVAWFVDYKTRVLCWNFFVPSVVSSELSLLNCFLAFFLLINSLVVGLGSFWTFFHRSRTNCLWFLS